MAWKNAKGGFVYWLNRLLNPDHPWTDYYDPTTGDDDTGQETLRGDSATYGAGGLESSSLLGTFGRAVEALVNKWTDAGVTPGEVQRNEMQMQNQEDIYQRQVTGMQKAGINPALMYGSGAQSAPSVNTQSSGSMSMSDLMGVFMMPLQKKLLDAQAQNQRDTGEAALINARANAAGVGIKEGELEVKRGDLDVRRGELSVKEYEAETGRIRATIEAYLAEAKVRLTDKEIDKMAHDIAYIDETTAYISKNYEVAMKNANAHQQQAAAALKSAEAAFQNALTNEYLSNYQSDVLFSTAYLNGLLSEEKSIDIDFLPEKYQAQISEMKSRGYFFDQQGRLVDKQGKLLDAQTAETYTRMATEITHATCEIVNTATGLIPGKRNPIGFRQ